jgi:hypothetical protein
LLIDGFMSNFELLFHSILIPSKVTIPDTQMSYTTQKPRKDDVVTVGLTVLHLPIFCLLLWPTRIANVYHSASSTFRYEFYFDLHVVREFKVNTHCEGALGSTEPLKMSTRKTPGGKDGRCVSVTTLPPS